MATVKKATTSATKKVAPAVAAKTAKQEKKTAPVAARQPAAKAKVAVSKKVEEPKKTPVKKVSATTPKVTKPVKAAEPKKVLEPKKVKESKEVEKKIPKTKSEIAKEVKVKVPKTSVKTSVPYQPSYQSLEDRVEEATAVVEGPLVRYSDTDLNEFRDIINKKLGDAKRELAYLQGLITRKDHLGGEADSRYMTMEDGTVSMEREQLGQMAGRQISYIDHLEKALIRIENKTYGICRVTGKLIEKARLKAVPHATLSLEAKVAMKK
ncbi:MAG: TraR/DksA C4-type zinc finger protein [Chitinophagaceae bacterium]